MYNVASVVVTGALLPALGIIAVFLRFWVRLYLRPNFVGIDDWLAVVSLVFVCAMGSNQILIARKGELGRDGQPTTPQRLYLEAKVTWAQHVIEKICYGCIKLCVLYFYRRAFPIKRFLQINSILIGIIIAWTLAFFLTEVFTCRVHPEVQWKDPMTSRGVYCTNESMVLLWFAITDVISDIAILSLPYPQIRKLSMSKRQKWHLSFIFMLGILSLIAGICRLGYVSDGFAENPKAINNSDPPTATYFWTTVEVSIGLIAANLPALAPLLSKAPNPSSMASYVRRKMSLSSIRKQSDHLFFTPHKHSESIGQSRSESESTVVPAISLVDMGSKNLHGSTILREASMNSGRWMSPPGSLPGKEDV